METADATVLNRLPDAMPQAHKVARLGRMTSTTCAVPLGMHDCLSGYAAKLQINADAVAQFDGNKATERGSHMESMVIDYAAKRTGLVATPAPMVTDAYPFTSDSTDALLLDAAGTPKAVVEAKTVTQYASNKWGDEMTDDVPERVLCQAHWHLLHWPQVDTCYVPALFGGDFVFGLWVVHRDKAFEAYLLEKNAAWHKRYIEDDEDVPVSASDADLLMLKKQYPRDYAGLRAPDAALTALAQERLALHAECKKADKALALVDNQLREAIGEHEGLDVPEMTVTYKRTRDSTEVDWKAVAHALDATETLILQHTHVVPGYRKIYVAKKRKLKTPVTED